MAIWIKSSGKSCNILITIDLNWINLFLEEFLVIKKKIILKFKVKKKKVFKKNIPFLIVVNKSTIINLNFLIRIILSHLTIIKNYQLLILIIVNFQTLFLKSNNQRIFKIHKKTEIFYQMNNLRNKLKMNQFKIIFRHFIKMILWIEEIQNW